MNLQTRQRLHPLIAASAVSVILVSMLGVATLAGFVPHSESAAPEHRTTRPGSVTASPTEPSRHAAVVPATVVAVASVPLKLADTLAPGETLVAADSLPRPVTAATNHPTASIAVAPAAVARAPAPASAAPAAVFKETRPALLVREAKPALLVKPGALPAVAGNPAPTVARGTLGVSARAPVPVVARAPAVSNTAAERRPAQSASVSAANAYRVETAVAPRLASRNTAPPSAGNVIVSLDPQTAQRVTPRATPRITPVYRPASPEDATGPAAGERRRYSRNDDGPLPPERVAAYSFEQRSRRGYDEPLPPNVKVYPARPSNLSPQSGGNDFSSTFGRSIGAGIDRTIGAIADAITGRAGPPPRPSDVTQY